MEMNREMKRKLLTTVIAAGLGLAVLFKDGISAQADGQLPPSVSGNAVTTTTSSSGGNSHVHHCEWVVTEEPTIDRLGTMVYRCSCGFIADTGVVDNASLIVQDILASMSNFPASGTAKIDLHEFHSLSPVMLKKISERADLSFEITYTYKNVRYVATIPANFDWESTMVSESGWEGLPFIASFPGVEVEEVK